MFPDFNKNISTWQETKTGLFFIYTFIFSSLTLAFLIEGIYVVQNIFFFAAISTLAITGFSSILLLSWRCGLDNVDAKLLPHQIPRNLLVNVCDRVFFLTKLEAYILQLLLERESGKGVFYEICNI